MDSFLLDLKFCLRRLLKTPSFTLVALLTLVVGIGMNSAMFSVVNAVLLQPLPYEESERLYIVWGRFPRLGYNELPASEPEFIDFQEQTQIFESVAAFVDTNRTLTGTDDPVKLTIARVSADLFPLLRQKAALGRTFQAEEDEAGHNRVTVLSHRLWQNRFGADPAVVGKMISLDGESHVVVGVMSQDFRFPAEAELWVPLGLDTANLRHRGEHYLKVVGRLKPGVTPERAAEEMKAIAYRFQQENPGIYPPQAVYGLTLVPLRQQLVGDIRPAFLVLLGTVGFVLLIACTNVTNLLLVRAQVRSREISLRMALGSSRWGLTRQFLIESLLLTTTGGLLGLLTAFGGVKLLVAINQENIPRSHAIGIDAWVLAFTLALSVLTGLALALIVAWRSLKVDLQETLKEGSHSTSSAGQQTVRSLLVISEVSLALVLLIGAGLMISSFRHLRAIDPGFRPEGLLSVKVSLLDSSYSEDAQTAGFYRELLESVSQAPGVEAVSLVSVPPFGGPSLTSVFSIEGRPFTHEIGQIPPIASLLSVDKSYFQTMRIPLLQGRYFTDLDYAGSVPVVILDEATARRHWPDENPIGKRLKLGGQFADVPWLTIVGVVGQIKDSRLEAEDKEHLYFPYSQRPENYAALMLRGKTDPMSLLPELRSRVKELDPTVPLYDARDMEQRIAGSMSSQTMSMVLLSLFAGTALVLAAIGLYGVVAYSVAQRTNEIGIRMALGAQTGEVFKMVLGHGLGLAVIGVIVGIAAALGLSRLMSSLLFGVSSYDPVTFGIAAVMLVGVALLASFLPARRATRVQPSIALRAE